MRSSFNAGRHFSGSCSSDFAAQARTLPLRALQFELGLETVDVAVDRSHREASPVLAVANHAIAPAQISLDIHGVPCGSVSGIVDRHVVMLAPEERHVGKGFAGAEH